MSAEIMLNPGKEKRVYSLHPWVFKGDIGHISGECEPGDIVRVVSSKGRFLAKAYYNPLSQIALRIMTYQDEPVDRELIFRRIHQSIEYRRAFADLKSCRLVVQRATDSPL